MSHALAAARARAAAGAPGCGSAAAVMPQVSTVMVTAALAFALQLDTFQTTHNTCHLYRTKCHQSASRSVATCLVPWPGAAGTGRGVLPPAAPLARAGEVGHTNKPLRCQRSFQAGQGPPVTSATGRVSRLWRENRTLGALRRSFTGAFPPSPSPPPAAGALLLSFPPLLVGHADLC